MPLRYKWLEGTSKSFQFERESTDEDRNMDDNALGLMRKNNCQE